MSKLLRDIRDVAGVLAFVSLLSCAVAGVGFLVMAP